MSNLNVQIKDKSGNIVYPKTLGSLVFNSSNQSLGGVEANAEVNVIESVKVNGSALTPDANRAVNVSVPTYSVVEQATPDSGYVATYYLSDGTSQQGSKIQIPNGGSGSTSIDGVTITRNSSQELQAVGVVDQNASNNGAVIKFYNVTTAEYNALVQNSALEVGAWYNISDDTVQSVVLDAQSMLSGVSGYNASVPQTLKHDSSGNLKWVNE